MGQQTECRKQDTLSRSQISGFRIAGISTCTPPRSVDNLALGEAFDPTEVRKVVQMAGIRHRRIADASVTSADLCFEAAQRLLQKLDWDPASITGLIFVTQSPDYFLPSSSCLIHQALGLSDQCAAFDMGLGCSGYPYGLYLGATMLRGGGHPRILVLQGETPSRFTSPDEHATSLLFGDVGSATALEYAPGETSPASFCLHTDGSGAMGLVIPGGGFRDREAANARDHRLYMDGAAIFNFTIKRVPSLIRDTLELAQARVEDVDSFVFHQSNRFIMKHLMKKCGLPPERVPFTIEENGNCGGASVAITMTRKLDAVRERDLRVLMIGYGVGLSWGSALMTLPREAVLLDADHTGMTVRPDWQPPLGQPAP
jgi:3-oxoacyl-[acyl-carrier-protein] synthase III